MQPILLLHGAIGAADQLQSLATVLNASYKVYTVDFSGHGKKPLPVEAFSIDLFANDVLSFMDEHGLKRVSIFGYSMGGYVAMYLARHYPEKVDKVVTLATKFHWDEPTAVKETQMLNADKIAEKVPAFADALEKRHTNKDWREVLSRTAAMLTTLGADNVLKLDNYKDITVESLLLLGDRDKMVSLEETVQLYKTLPKAQLGVLPGTPHPIEQVDTDLIAFFVRHFIK